MRELLDDDQIAEFCAGRGRWSRDGDRLVGQATAASFPDAIEWVNRIAAEAEALDHHPDVDIRWRTLSFALSTHSAGGITKLDALLAERIDDIVDAVSRDHRLAPH